MKNILFMHGGGPTAVINASLSGSLKKLYELDFDGRILFSRFGTGGLLKKDVREFPRLSESELEKLSRTPGSAIGTGRDHLEPEDYSRLADILEELEVGYVVMTGGNGTMDTTRNLAEACKAKGIVVVGTPKTMDNDLSVTDHAPGFPSAARYMAASVREVIQDVRGLPIHVVVIEAFGRDAGWITASSVMAETREYGGPDMILLPEVAFDEEAFLARVEELYRKKGGVVVVASEGLRYADGRPIVEPVFQVGRSVYFGDVSSHLAQLVTRKLGIKSRSEKPGLLGRASMAWQSELDRQEAMAAGEESVVSALNGRTGYMSIIERLGNEPYSSRIVATPIIDEILDARCMPPQFIDEADFGVTEDFKKWVRPLVGEDLGDFISLI